MSKIIHRDTPESNSFDKNPFLFTLKKLSPLYDIKNKMVIFSYEYFEGYFNN